MLKKKNMLSILCGAVWAAAIIVLSRLLIRFSGSLFRAVGSLAGLGEELVEQISLALLQLRGADLVSPWLVALVLGAALGLLYHKCSHKALRRLCALVLQIPFLLTGALCTQINDIRPVSVLTRRDQEVALSPRVYSSQGESWYFGYGRRQILPDENSGQPLYIAGYNNAWEISGVLDYCEARALWLDTGAEGVLIIGIDCVGLDSGTIDQIRSGLSDLPGCAAVHVFSTHTHAGPDTLGLWGPIGQNGKNDAYMQNLISAAVEAGKEAAADRKAASLHYGYVETQDMYRDSRDPQVFDANLYQLRLVPADGSAGLRLFFYGAHAESLRGDNTLLSRDFPGMLCDGVTLQTGDNAMFFPGAVGGLIMTKEFVRIFNNDDAVLNLETTANKLIDYALSIDPASERELKPVLKMSGTDFIVPMDNTAFVLYKSLGILNNRAVQADSATGHGVQTELSVVMLDEIALTLLPGEIFPELVLGGEYGDANKDGVNPEPLCDIAAEHGIDKLLIIGLADDEIGYIVPPSDFLLNENMPYLERTLDYKGEDHYEETNSIGPECAGAIARAFRSVLENMP